MKHKKFNKKEIIGFSLFIIGLILLGYWINLEYGIDKEEKINNFNISYEFQINESKNLLIQILEYEISQVNLSDDAVCVNYSRYYNKTLSKKYPQLDIRWERYVDICNDLTLCDSYHTYLLVNGFSLNCILDQTIYTCIEIQKGKVYSNGY